MNPYRLKNVFEYLTSNNQLLKKKLKLGTSEIPIPPKRKDVIDIEAINRFNKANPRVDTTSLKPLSVKHSNVRQSNVSEPNEGAIQSAFDTATRDAQFEGYPAPSYDKFKSRYLKKNMKADGGRMGYKDGEGVITIDDKIDEMISFYKDYLKQGGKMNFQTFSKKYIPENFADGGRIGYKDGPKFDVQASGTKSGKQQIQGAPDGITSDKETINAILTMDIPLTEKVNLIGDLQYGKFRDKIEYNDDEIFLDDPKSYRDRNIGLDYNRGGEGFSGSATVGDRGPEFKIKYKKSFADGGMLVKPSDDGSRPGYKEDKYTSSKGTPGVRYTAKEIKNISDDIANYPGISLKKVGDSYYFRFRIQKGDNKISESKVATKENLNLLKKRQKKFMKENYPNVLSNADFENLRMQEANINLSAKDFAEVLNKKNKTTIQGYNWTKDTVQKLQGDLKLNSYIQPEGASGKLRSINNAKKIVRGFNPEELKRLNQIPDINLRNAAIRNKANSITGRTNYIKKTGTLQGITKNNQSSLWKNFYESSKKNNRIILGGTFNGKDLSFRKNWPKKADGTIDWFIKDKKTNKPAWQMLEFTDTQTPKGPTTFTYEGLQNQVDDAFGKGYFARSTNVYSKSRELYGKNIMFEGKMQPIGRVIAKQRIINDFKKNNNGKMPTEKYINGRITTSTPTQVHHTKGIGNDPYSVQLVSRDANQKLNAAELTYTSELKKAKGDPLKIKTLNDSFKKTVNQISDTYGGIQYDIDGSVIGKKATEQTAYTSAIQESGMNKNQQKKLNISLELLKKSNPEAAKKVTIALNSGLPIDDIAREIARIPGVKQFRKAFTAIGGPIGAAIEAAFAFATYNNEISKGTPHATALEIAQRDASFGLAGEVDQARMTDLTNAGSEIGVNTTGFQELKTILDLEKSIEKEKSLLTQMSSITQDIGSGGDGPGLSGEFDIQQQQNKISDLENQYKNQATKIKSLENFDDLFKDYNSAVEYLARKQYNKTLPDRKNRVYPDQGTMGSDFTSTILNPIKSFLPQNLMETGLSVPTSLIPGINKDIDLSSITRPYVRAAQKIPFIGSIFEPTSDAAKLSAMSQEEKDKRALDMNIVKQNYHPVMGTTMTGQQMEPYYEKFFSKGGIASLTDTIPPESGPTPHGLPYVYNNVKKI